MKSFVSRFAARLPIVFAVVALCSVPACSSGGTDAGSAPPPIPPCPATLPGSGAVCQGPNVCTYDGSGNLVASGALSATSRVAICPDINEAGTAAWSIESPDDAAIGEASPIDGGSFIDAGPTDATVTETASETAAETASEVASEAASETATEAASEAASEAAADAGTDATDETASDAADATTGG